MKVSLSDLSLYAYCPMFFRETKKNPPSITKDPIFTGLRACLLNFYSFQLKFGYPPGLKTFCSEWDKHFWPLATKQGYSYKECQDISIKAWIYLADLYKKLDECKPLFVNFNKEHALGSSKFIQASHEALLYDASKDSLVLLKTCSSKSSLINSVSRDLEALAAACLIGNEVALPITIHKWFLNLSNKASRQELSVSQEKQISTRILIEQLLNNIEREVFYPSPSLDCTNCEFNGPRCSV